MMGVENEISGGKPQLTAEKRALLEKRLRGGGVKTPAPRIPRAPQMDKAPLSFAQQRLWFFDNLEPGSPLYNLPSAIRMQGELDVLAVQKALDVIVQRHEALRTRFLNEEGTAVQMIQPPRAAELKVMDLTATPAAESETALQELLRAEVTKPFDLTAGYLMRTLLVRTAVNEHVMLVTMHHIISDSWSLTVFFREFAALYGAVKQGREPVLAELPLNYVDYALWQRQEVGGETMAKHWQYWERQLSEAPPLLELPAENSRPAKQSFRGAWVARALPSALAKDARALCKQKNVTLFMLMLAAFKVLVFRYTQQTSLVVGSPIAGRTQFETEGLIGFFVNTLVLRTDMSGNPSFSEALGRVRGVTLESYTHQEFPFDKLVEELQPVRSPAYSPLVQLLFALNSEETQHLKLEGLSISSLPLDTGTSKFDMILTVQEAAGELTLHAEYNVDLFSAASMNRLLGNFQVLLEAVLADPEQRIEEVSLLSREERDLLLKEWSGKKTHYPSGRSLADLFEEQAVRNAGKVALSLGRQTLTYQALNERANSLAHHLLSQGTKRGDMVVIFAERSLETMIAVLAIIKAGAAYVSLEPSTPTERLQGMLQDLQPPVILSQTKFSAKLKELAAATAGASAVVSKNVFLDEPNTSIFNGNKANPALGLTPEDAAYVSFTSGSTGRPKGVRVPHRGVVRLVKNTDYAPFQEDEVFLQMAPIAFDASTLEIWGPLLNGGKLVIFPPHLPSMDELAGFIRQQGITTLWLTAGLFHQLVEHDTACFKGLRRVLAGGDVLSPAHVRQAFEQCEVINGYGPTENTTFTCCHRITNDSLKRKTIPIGRPIANTEVYVLDEHRNLVPIGVAGELFAAGDGLALDYLAAPELTEQKFVRQAVASGPVKRMYRTGDKVRWLENGELEFLGRFDSQTKIRGFRIEPGEIENALKQHPKVGNCLVVVTTNDRREKELGVYYTSTDGGDLAVQELRAFLRHSLPDYMVPAIFNRLAEFPLNANGKVDWKLLPPLTVHEDAAGMLKGLLEPRNNTERQMVKVWEDVLGIHPVGVQDNFFEMGGHSLLAVKLVTQLEKAFGTRLPVAEIFLRPTVEQLAEHLQSLQPRSSAQHVVEIQGKGTNPPLCLVHGAGGGMFWGYTNLSHYLGTEQPIIAFSSQGMNGQQEFKTIEEMAACYVAELRAYQPQGPYRLGGYCFGGNVAYEMARLLEEQGEKVALLALINCVPPNSSYDRAKVDFTTGSKFVLNLGYWTGYFLQLESKDQRNLLWWKAKGVVKRIKRLGRFLGRKEQAIDVEEYVDLSAQPVERRELWKTHINALMSHHPKPYRGHITLFRTRGHSLWCSFDDSYGWNSLADNGTTIRYVAGAHESILAEPYVKATANEIRICLQKA